MKLQWSKVERKKGVTSTATAPNGNTFEVCRGPDNNSELKLNGESVVVRPTADECKQYAEEML